MTITYVPKNDPLTRWPAFDGTISDMIPKTRAEVLATFGNPGTRNPDKDWYRENIVELHGDTAIPGIPPRSYFQVHRLALPYVREAMRRSRIVCPDYAIERAGCYVYRHVRHDPSRPLSLHSWGIAIDINPQDNRAVTFERGKAPEFFSDEWKKVWPKGMPRECVDAWLSVGWTWGADWDRDGDTSDGSFVDPMHFQLATCG